jgi:hypothetical protein
VNYRFFEELSSADARRYLDAFLAAGRASMNDFWQRQLQERGTSAVPPYFSDVAARIRVVATSPPEDLPEFIVESMERHHGGFRDFGGDDDRVTVLRAAFFLGAAFIHGYPTLSWAVGRRDRAEEGQPVVTGFRTDADLPVLVVAENLLLEHDPQKVSRAIATWERVV